MTTDLPDPHACPHCGHNGLATRWGETICGMCNAPRATATPGCPVRNAMLSRATDETFPKITAESIAEGEAAVRDGKWITLDELRQSVAEETQEQQLARFRQEHSDFPSIAEETARERKVHGGGPRVVG